MRRATAILVLAASSAACAADSRYARLDEGAGERGGQSSGARDLIAVAEGVFSFRSGQYSNMILQTRDGFVVLDPLDPGAATRIVAHLRRLAPDLGLAAIVYSHHHADHAGGARVLLDAYGDDVPIIAHELTARLLESHPDDVVVSPSLLIQPPWSRRFGELTLELRSVGPNHTADMLVGWVREHRLVYAVDFLNNASVAYRDLPGAHLPEYWDSIDTVASWPIRHAVFGHGPPGDARTVHAQARYWADVRAATRAALAAGQTEQEAASSIRLPAYSRWSQYDEWFQLNVRAAYRHEASVAAPIDSRRAP